MTVLANHLRAQTKPSHLDNHDDEEVSESSLNSVNVVLGELDFSNDLTEDMERSPPTRGRPLARLDNSFRPPSRSRSGSHAGESDDAGESDAASDTSSTSVSSEASRTSWERRARSRSKDDTLSQIKVIPVPPSPNKGRREERTRWEEFTGRMSFFDDEPDVVENTSLLDDFVGEFAECSYFFRCLMDDAVETLEAEKEIHVHPKQMPRRGHNLLP